MLWVGGRIVPDDALSVSALDRTFEHGLGLFETLRTWSGHPTLLARHRARMAQSARALGLPLEESALPDAAAASELLKAEAFDGDAMLRITLTGGGADGAPSIVWMRASPLPPPNRAGAVVELGSWEVSAGDLLARYKTLNYWPRRRAFEEGRARGLDEVLSHTTPFGQDLWEGSRTNVFLVQGDLLVTPPLHGPIVPGVMRGAVIEQARAIPMEVREVVCLRSDLGTATEVFLTNSVRGIIPVARVQRARPNRLTPAWTRSVPGVWTARLWTQVSAWLHEGGRTP